MDTVVKNKPSKAGFSYSNAFITKCRKKEMDVYRKMKKENISFNEATDKKGISVEEALEIGCNLVIDGYITESEMSK